MHFCFKSGQAVHDLKDSRVNKNTGNSSGHLLIIYSCFRQTYIVPDTVPMNGNQQSLYSNHTILRSRHCALCHVLFIRFIFSKRNSSFHSRDFRKGISQPVTSQDCFQKGTVTAFQCAMGLAVIYCCSNVAATGVIACCGMECRNDTICIRLLFCLCRTVCLF